MFYFFAQWQLLHSISIHGKPREKNSRLFFIQNLRRWGESVGWIDSLYDLSVLVFLSPNLPDAWVTLIASRGIIVIKLLLAQMKERYNDVCILYV